jgi:hypothetical protein
LDTDHILCLELLILKFAKVEPTIHNFNQSIDCKVIGELRIPLKAIFDENAHSDYDENLI